MRSPHPSFSQDSSALLEELRHIGLQSGLDAIGVASAEPFASTRLDLEMRRAEGLSSSMHFTFGNPERSTTPSMSLAGARSIVVGVRSYRRTDPPTHQGPVGKVARYVQRDEYGVLRSGLNAISDRIKQGGWKARVLCDDNALVDREAAFRAGMGWYGKNSNLLMAGRGSWFVIGSVLTDAELPFSQDRVDDGCGTCARCIDRCPTKAIVAPGVVDARRCLAWLLQAEGVFPPQYRSALGSRIYGCDDCQEVCPINRRGIERELDALPTPLGVAPSRAEEAYVDLVEMLETSDQDLISQHGRWYIPRRDPRYLRRNALVALGNIGDGNDDRVKRALLSSLAHNDALVRGHAVWAAMTLGRGDLIENVLVGERDPLVLEELARFYISASSSSCAS